MERLLVLLWHIWYCRNYWVYDQKLFDIKGILGWSFSFARTYQEAHMRIGFVASSHTSTVSPTGRPLEAPWSPPTEGWFKLNIDVGLRPSNCCMSFGLVIQDLIGYCVASAAIPTLGLLASSIAEVMAMLVELQLYFRLGFYNIEVERSMSGILWFNFTSKVGALILLDGGIGEGRVNLVGLKKARIKSLSVGSPSWV
uniref:RNase H type-1 domain-containing protein n=1 Tax=Cannabis sativa TaxID=3483 RepID=A0A803PFL2_CANSA